MHEEALKEIAGQLRQPHGEHATEVGERMNKGNYLMNVAAIETLAPQAQDTILEIGMGNGFFVKDILSMDPSVHYSGCDFSEAMIEAATQLNQEVVNTGQASFILAPANSLPFEESTFNKVFTVDTIYFWENPTPVLDEIKRVLKPQGQLLIAFRPKWAMEQYPFTQYGFTMYTMEELVALLPANGFVVSQSFEKQEPDQEINGETVIAAFAIILAEKI